MIRLSRWDKFVLLLWLAYSVQCWSLSAEFSDTWWKYWSTVVVLFMLHRLGSNPHKLPVRMYSILLPVALLFHVVGNYFARRGNFELPLLPFFMTWALLQLPLFLWNPKRGTLTGRFSYLPIIYVMVLFWNYSWRLAPMYFFRAFVHHDFSATYTWLCLILPQFICCNAAARRAVRMFLTRVSWRRTVTGCALGISLMVLWEVVAALIFRIGGASESLSVTVFGAVPPEEYANIAVAIWDHIMVITGTYIFVALGEETFFRLILPSFIRNKLRLANRESFWTTFLLSGALFGSIHWQQSDPIWTKILYSAGSGLIFATVMRVGKGMQASTIVHAITNDGPRMTW